MIFTRIIVFAVLVISTYAIKCYVCGEGSESPFYETKSTNINQSFVKEKIQSSCDGFHSQMSMDERHKFEMDCPSEYRGCLTKVGALSTIRTCEKFNVNDCKRVNNFHYCICQKDLCNGDDTSSIISKYGDIEVDQDNKADDYENDTEDDSEDDNEDTSGDYEDEDDEYGNTKTTMIHHDDSQLNKTINAHDNSRVNESTEHVTTKATNNSAVNFNYNAKLFILLPFCRIYFKSFLLR